EATPVAENSARFPVKYYITAMIFLLFDIEVVFLYPWSVTFEMLGLWGLIEMLSFLVLLTLPFIYVWRRGGLEWD
ncbi:MAG: NADH-quinone oxidoreductase subunit A, partial [Actinomycetaceae bacterium]|nr:NADH-quinone oxidoreductase subunit A [Actinomycetaceae bacterium]